MLRPILLFILLAAGALALRAQDYPATPIDGPAMKADSLRQKPEFSPLMGYSVYSRIRMQGILAPIGFESREERAARINAATSADVLSSVGRNLELYRPPHYSREEILALLREHEVKTCCYGHIHGKGCRMSFNGTKDGCEFHLVSADFVNFEPVLLLP